MPLALLLNFNGADESTTITDSGPVGHTVVVYGNAQLDTAQSKWGGASLLLDGTGDQVRIESNLDEFLFGTGDFTIECWIRTTETECAICASDKNSGTGSWYLGLFDGKLSLAVRTPTQIYLDAATGAVNTGDWVHVAMSRASGTMKLFAAGVQVAQRSDSYTYGDATVTSFDIGGMAIYTPEYDLAGHIDDFRVDNSTGLYTTGFTPPTAEFSVIPSPTALIVVDTMLGAPSLLAHTLYALVSVPTMLGAPALLALHDFTGLLDAAGNTVYLMDLITPGGDVRVPISSWQATMRTDEAQYAQAVIPSCANWLIPLTDATEFVVYRRVVLSNGVVMEYEMARAPVEQLNIYSGSRNYTATISGYTAAEYMADENPPTANDRTMTGLRTVSSSTGLRRARCAVDWLLRPSHRAYVDGEELLVDWINYYVGGGDEYMDIGESA